MRKMYAYVDNSHATKGCNFILTKSKRYPRKRTLLINLSYISQAMDKGEKYAG